MRVAFEVFGGAGWTGGTNYLANLLSAIAELPGRPISPVLFTGLVMDPATLGRISPYLAERPIQSAYWTKGTWQNRKRIAKTFLVQRDDVAEKFFRDARIDLVFVHATWYGCRFPMPTLVWIGDFQHCYLPHMFTRLRYWKRELGFRGLTKCGTTIMASSETGRRECEQFYPAAKNKLASLPFVVRIPHGAMRVSPAEVRNRYALSDKFFYMPNQFWRHKNHLGVVDALYLLRQEGRKVLVVASGNPHDIRDPSHFQRVIDKVREYGLEDNFKFLGLIPYHDIFGLMRASVAVVNPSFYEGWSTTVEEAKSIGVPLLLSDIPVHREQAHAWCKFFDPANPADIARILDSAWSEWEGGPHIELEAIAAQQLERRCLDFANNFVNIATQTIARYR